MFPIQFGILNKVPYISIALKETFLLIVHKTKQKVNKMNKKVKVAISAILMMYCIFGFALVMNYLFSLDSTIVNVVTNEVEATNKLFILIIGQVASAVLFLVPCVQLFFYIQTTLNKIKGE